jgi:hypothetical protein
MNTLRDSALKDPLTGLLTEDFCRNIQKRSWQAISGEARILVDHV